MAKVAKHQEWAAAYALRLIPGVGFIKAKRIFSEHDLWEDYLKAYLSNFEYRPTWLKQSINGHEIKHVADSEIELQLKKDVTIIDLFHQYYPPALAAQPDAPILLFVKGNLSKLAESSIAIVGTRIPSEYGINNTQFFSRHLAETGIVINSGFAHGVDICAHQTCIKHGGYTTAVLGSGLGHIYPAANKKYISALTEQGCLISELAYYSKPNKENFPSRNRIVAAMSKATLVIESKIKGGSMITARLAFDYNKEVFAIPGSIQHEPYTGNHALIKNQIAQICTHPSELISLFPNINTSKTQSEKANLPAKFQALERILKVQKSASIHELKEQLNMSISILQSQLTELELMGCIQVLSGNRYSLIP